MFNGKNSKKSSQYFMEYCSLKEEIRGVLSFRYFCTLEIHNLLRYSYYGEKMINIAHPVDEVCKEVETRRLPPRAKRGGKRKIHQSHMLVQAVRECLDIFQT